MGQGAAAAAQIGRTFQPLHIVHGLRAGLRHGDELALLLHHFLHLTAQRIHAGLQVGCLGCGQAFNGGVHPLKEPRVAQRAPGDHHAVTAGGLHHLHRILCRVDVAVAQHRHSDGILHPGNDLRVDAGGVHLLPGTGMHRNEGCAGLLTGLGTLHCSDVVGIPALAHFHGDRPFCICHNLLHDAAAAVRVQHQLAACAAGHDLGGRAAHVDIHKVELVLFDGGGGFAHDLGHFAKDLHAIGCTVGFGLEQAHRLVVAVHQRPAGHHFAHSKACTVLGHQAAAGCIRKARHRAEHRPVRQDDIADFQRFHWLFLAVIEKSSPAGELGITVRILSGTA